MLQTLYCVKLKLNCLYLKVYMIITLMIIRLQLVMFLIIHHLRRPFSRALTADVNWFLWLIRLARLIYILLQRVTCWLVLVMERTTKRFWLKNTMLSSLISLPLLISVLSLNLFQKSDFWSVLSMVQLLLSLV